MAEIFNPNIYITSTNNSQGFAIAILKDCRLPVMSASDGRVAPPPLPPPPPGGVAVAAEEEPLDLELDLT